MIFDGVFADIRHAVRSLRRSGWFALTAIALLACGIAATTLMLGLVYAVNFRAVPYPAASELVGVMAEQGPSCASACLDDMTAAAVRDLRSSASLLRGVSTYTDQSAIARAPDGKEDLDVAEVSDSFFVTLGVRAQMGRWLMPEEIAEASASPVVVSYRFWKRHRGSTTPLGVTLTLDGTPYTIVGVMPADFSMPVGADAWIPMKPPADGLQSDLRPVQAFGRMQRGASIERARTQLAVLGRQQRLADSSWNNGRDAWMYSLQYELRPDSRSTLRLLVAIVVILGIITYANAQGLFIVRALKKQRELAIRAAIGSPRWRVARYLCVEAMLVVIAACALAALLIAWGRSLAQASLGTELPSLYVVGSSTILFCGGAVALLTTFGLGLWAFHSVWRDDLRAAIASNSGPMVFSTSALGVRGMLVITQVVASVVLGSAAVTLYRTYAHLSHVELGFDADNLLVSRLDTRQTAYDSADEARTLVKQLVERLRTSPFAAEAAVWRDASPMALTSPREPTITVEGSSMIIDARHCMHGSCIHPIVSQDGTPEFFRAAGVRILRGRSFTSEDQLGSAPVVIVNQFAAEHWWPNQDPIGKRFKIGGPASGNPWLTVVGVTDVRRPIQWIGMAMTLEPNAPRYAIMFRPLMQVADPPDSHLYGFTQSLWVGVRARSNPAVSEMRSMDEEIRETAPGVTFDKATTIRHEFMVEGNWQQLHDNQTLAECLALIALALSTAGIYGIIADVVARRSREMGIRLSVGAHPSQLIRLIVRQGLLLGFLGSAIGAGICVMFSSTLGRLILGAQNAPIPGSSLATPFVLIPIALVAIGTCVVASWIPAARIARLRPSDALRAE